MSYRVAMNFRTESGNGIDFALVEQAGSVLAEHRPAVHTPGGPNVMVRVMVEAESPNLALEAASSLVRDTFGSLGEPLVFLSATTENC